MSEPVVTSEAKFSTPFGKADASDNYAHLVSLLGVSRMDSSAIYAKLMSNDITTSVKAAHYDSFKHCSINYDQITPASVAKLALEWDEISMVGELGRGAFGVVASAMWRGVPVAVKTVSQGALDIASIDLKKEIEILQYIRHPNIVLFFGTGTTPAGSPFLVMEMVKHGTLSKYLASNEVIPWSLKISFVADIARGMAFLHSLHRMHRDLKSDNLLVSVDLSLKIADFGTATLTGQSIYAYNPARSNGLTRSNAAANLDDLFSQHTDKLISQHSSRVGTLLWSARRF